MNRVSTEVYSVCQPGLTNMNSDRFDVYFQNVHRLAITESASTDYVGAFKTCEKPLFL